MPEEIIDIEAAKKLAKTEAGELKALRYTPQGSLNHPVTTMSITFNQPMVPLTGLEELKEGTHYIDIKYLLRLI